MSFDSSLKARLFAGVVMVTGFLLMLLSGKTELLLILVIIILAKAFQELRCINMTLTYNVQGQTKQIIFDWVLFGISTFIVLNIIYYNELNLLFGFMMYTIWFMNWILFVLNKNNKNLTLYFCHTSWVHLSIFYTLIQPIVIHTNISKGGLFWFILPSFIIVCNDTAAYFCGKCFGKNKLIQLSPNKTLEGYMGAIFVTTFFGILLGRVLSQYDFLINTEDLELYKKVDVYSIFISLFGSIVCPFGGFFSSAVKRAGGIKDFGNFIPGHGGITDRVDCHLFMSLFVLLFYQYIKS